LSFFEITANDQGFALVVPFSGMTGAKP